MLKRLLLVFGSTVLELAGAPGQPPAEFEVEVGVEDEEGGAVAGAAVDLLRNRSVMFTGLPGELLGRARTEKDGAVRLAVPFDSGWILRISHPGYCREHVLLEGPDPGLDEPSMVRRRVTLRRGGAIRLRVVDLAGRAVSRCEVAIRRAREQQVLTGSAPESRALESTKAGTILVDRLPHGPSFLGVRVPGYAIAEVLVDVPEGPVNVPELREVSLQRGATLSGVVRDGSSGAPLAGISIQAVAEFGRSGPCLSGITDEKGRFTLEGATDRPHQVEVSAGHRLLKTFRWVMPKSLPWDLTVEGLSFVRFEVAAGDPSVPIDTFWAMPWTTAEPSHLHLAQYERFSSTGGKAELLMGPKGRYLHVQALGCAPQCIGPIPDFEAGSTTTLKVRLAAGSSLSGRVTTTSGQPMEGVSIRLLEPPEAPRFFEAVAREAGRPDPRWVTRTDAAGDFRLDHLPRGRFIVHASFPSFAGARSAPFSCDGSRPVVFPVIQLFRGAVIHGVIRARDGALEPGALIVVLPIDQEQPRSRTVVADARGHFEVGSLPPGRYRVFRCLSKHWPGDPQPRRVTLEEGERKRVDLP